MLSRIIRSIAICLLLTAVLTECTPIPVYRVHPLKSKEARWIMGHEVLKIEGQKYHAALTFAKQVNNMLAFDVQVVNISDSTISVIPDSMYSTTYLAYQYKGPERQKTPQIPRKEIYAHNPEQELINVDYYKNHEDASYKTDRVMAPIYSLIDAVFDAATTNNQNNQNQSEADNIEYNTYLTRREVEHTSTIQSLSALHFQWSTEALRRTDLLPNESVRGLVFFTADPGAHFLGLHLNIAGENHLIYFEQVKYK